MIDACDACLRRGFLVAHLAPRIAGLLHSAGRRAPGLLGLPEQELVVAVAGRRAEQAMTFLERFDAERARERLAARSVLALCRHGEAYPPLLLELGDPPAVLFGLGRTDALAALRDEPAVALVGTRRASPYGTEVAYALGRGLGAAGVPVVSGLALGIDGTAHRGCLDGGGLPVAVLAGGPDVVYPRRHRQLHERIRGAGMVMSELPPGTEPFRWSFPARNRIMAGLARMTLVVEAAQPSGSLITSEFAKDLGRSVAAVPGRVTSAIASGANNLLRDGAIPITGARDVLDELFGVGVRDVPPLATAPPRPQDPVLRSVLEAAERSSSVEEIARAAGLSTGEARTALGRLETDGHLKRLELGGWEPVL
ncbi:MAG TPA: DNA-processing protein DprA [Thermoleophilaceae bacterium]|nr:DNA-processing protein DprA [Thermoleophilaceae bacterium]